LIERLLQATLTRRLSASPAVALVGPRQSGKTTLARMVSAVYYDLEQESDRLRLDLEWPGVTKEKRVVVLDEAQAWPEVFPRLRGAIDERRKVNGRFLLLGSVSPTLMTEVSESLAGRLALLELTPLLWHELPSEAARRRRWLCGGFPDGGVLAPRAYPDWEADYLSLLVERDLPNWGLPARPQVTRRLLRMLAATHGQIWNASDLGKSLGLSYHTVNSYVDYLEGAFLIRRLPSYHANIKKRLVKSPRVYWRDTGLLHALLNVVNQQSLLEQPWVGRSWEGFVIEQILGLLEARGRRHDAFYLRTSDGMEIDLVLQIDGEVWAIETKLTSSPSPHDLSRLDAIANLIEADRRFLISQASISSGDETRASHGLASFLDWMSDLSRAPG
jgi:predicted AAA+ superfamily ATPase